MHWIVLGADKVVLKLLILDLKLLCLVVEQSFQKYTMITQEVPIYVRKLI